MSRTILNLKMSTFCIVDDIGPDDTSSDIDEPPVYGYGTSRPASERVTSRSAYGRPKPTVSSYGYGRPASESPVRSSNAYEPPAMAQVTSSCSAPPQPLNGEWKLDRTLCKLIQHCRRGKVPEDTSVGPGTRLMYSCDSGYRANGSTDVFCIAQGNRAQWSPIPECVEVKCESLGSVSTEVSCTRSGKWVSCDSPVLPGTQASLNCRPGYKRPDFISTRNAVVTCNANGKWEPQPITCIPACGVAIADAQTFITGGKPAKITEFPWHTTLYKQDLLTGSEKVFICGGTIIHTHLVLTAAHCVYDEITKTTEDPRKFFLRAGNIFRDYDDPNHDPKVVKGATVKHVHVNCKYYGLTGNFGSDIALLELQQPFEFSGILRPACLDNSGFSHQFLEPGVFGKVAGFRRTEKAATSRVLQTLTVPYISYSECKASKHGVTNEAFISEDKFCAGYNNGSAVCDGDSGGGLVLKKGDLWYVMGIVSVGLGVNYDTGEGTCDKDSYSLYTKVSLYTKWIQEVLVYVESNQKFPACPTPIRNVTSHLTTGPNVKPLLAASSICSAPPQPLHGTWKLHADFCEDNVTCSPSEGDSLTPGSVLIYECPWGIEGDESADNHCGAPESKMMITICGGTSVYESDCGCIENDLCFQTPVMNKDGSFSGRFQFRRCVRSQYVCCPKAR